MFEIVQENAFYTSIYECSISNMCAQQVMHCTFIKKKKKIYIYIYIMYCTSTRPSRLGWPARLYIEYTVTFSYKVMRRLRKTYKEFLQE